MLGLSVLIFLACFINLVDPPKIVKLVSEHEVEAQQSIALDCQAEGNPQPSYTWTPCNPLQSVCQKSVLRFQASDQSVYAFTCEVTNNLGSDKRSTFLCKLLKHLLAYKWHSIYTIISFRENIVACTFFLYPVLSTSSL